ncbi:MAG: hypothetical protein GAK28_02200 [Luteibacter sp.]|uniref:hypothetical protein n=1 Tax=Luteibacter sp. TaxID=1886636 RepID=UPI001382932A|nr:hypothetical protein [Luteibacter sp.]KAF1006881.1 MAG: hypothetical protein GAK28_02200 [Luteibacter sp.]
MKPALQGVIALMFSLSALQAGATEKYFGYYGGDYSSDAAANPGGLAFPEMKDHINLYSILNWTGTGTPEGKQVSEQHVLEQLEAARLAHVHAIVPAFPFVFQRKPGTHCNITDTDAARAWSSLAQKMVDRGYLIPGDPVHSVVVATYIVDEPNADENCLADVDGQANPAWVNAVNAIKQAPQTATLPIASIMTDNFQKNMRQGIQLLDWVGFDHYGYSDSKWQKAMNTLKSVAPGKKYIVVPGAMEGCNGVTVDNAARFFNAIENDPDVTWIAPFTWFSGAGGVATCKGVRDIPSVRATYTAEGNKIKGMQCNASFGDKAFCGKVFGAGAAIETLLD